MTLGVLAVGVRGGDLDTGSLNALTEMENGEEVYTQASFPEKIC